MEKFNIFLFILLILSTSIFSQKTIIPKKGIVVFKSSEEIYDLKLYEASKKDFFKSMLQGVTISVKNERAEMGVETDSVRLRKITENGMFEELFSSAFSNKNKMFSMEYKDSIVVKIEKGNVAEQTSLVINCKTRKFISDYTKGIYDYSNIKILSIKEDRKTIRTINGYKCYKVTYSFIETSENLEEDYFNQFISVNQTSREMWVTNQIKSEFHAVINDKIILDKYYPLQILEYSSIIKGVKTIYTIDKFNIE